MSSPARVDVWVARVDGRQARAAFVRAVLARRLQEDPGALRLVRNPNGKPRLAAGRKSIEFNVSSSDGLAVCAVANTDIGVDVERVRRDLPWKPAARRFLTRGEYELVERGGCRAFFVAWTLKESIVKAYGASLAQALEGLDVEVATRDGHGRHGPFALRVVRLAEDYTAAVAVRADQPVIRVREWNPLDRRSGSESLVERP